MKRLERSSVPVVALSHPGRKRKENEDRYGVSSYQLDTLGPQPVLLAVLSDGIGGHRAGEIAAELAVEWISQVVADSDAQDPTKILTYAVQAASDAIRDQAKLVVEQAGMGATCACAWMIGEKLYTATVGDSRVYLLRDEKILRLSTDHTWVQEAIENGMLLPEEVTGHPNAHIIRRYLGSPVAPDVDLRLRIIAGESDEQAELNQGFKLEPRDRILLTSDGLTDLVSDTEIQDAYLQNPAEEATRLLIELANSRGGHDNITLVTFEKQPQVVHLAEHRAKTPSNSWKWVGIGCAGMLAVILVAAGMVSGFLLLQERWQGGVTPEVQPTATLMLGEQPTAYPDELSTVSPDVVIPSATPSPTAQPTIPVDAGPTLTPWPTNTLAAP